MTCNPEVSPIATPSPYCDDLGIPHYLVPIVDGVPKLLFTDDDVADMFSVSVSTVRNRYCRTSRWYDPRFPVPRSTDGHGGTRKAAVRWFWLDLFLYASGLPPVTDLRQLNKHTRDIKTQPPHLVAGTNFML